MLLSFLIYAAVIKADKLELNTGLKLQFWGQVLRYKSDDYSIFSSIKTARFYLNTDYEGYVIKSNFDFVKGSQDGSYRDAVTLRDFYVERDGLNLGLFRIPFSRYTLKDSFQYLFLHPPYAANPQNIFGDFRAVGFAYSKLFRNLKPSFGIFNGASSGLGRDSKNSPLATGRIEFQFAEPLESYVLPASYMSKKNVANIGFSFLVKGFNTGAGDKNLTAFNLDFFLENRSSFLLDTGISIYDIDGKTNSFFIESGYLFKNSHIAGRFEYNDREGKIIGGDDRREYAVVYNRYYKQGIKSGIEIIFTDFENEGSQYGIDKDGLSITVQLQIVF